MNESLNENETTLQQAVDELQGMILVTYPGTTFDIGPGGDDPFGTYITAQVDIDDPDEVMDLVIERLLHFQIEEALPVYVVPVRNPERAGKLRQALGAGYITGHGSAS